MAIKVPQKPRHGFHSIRELTRCVNGLIDYVSALVFIGKNGIEVHQSQHNIEILGSNPIQGDSSYDGFFKATIDGDSIKILAGYAYYNGKIKYCEEDSVSKEEGYVLLGVGSDGFAGYFVESEIPDMTFIESEEDIEDDVSYYPIAEIKRENGEWKVRQLCYGVPSLFCFGPCDDEDNNEDPYVSPE